MLTYTNSSFKTNYFSWMEIIQSVYKIKTLHYIDSFSFQPNTYIWNSNFFLMRRRMVWIARGINYSYIDEYVKRKYWVSMKGEWYAICIFLKVRWWFIEKFDYRCWVGDLLYGRIIYVCMFGFLIVIMI
jgi:hypothetical protein